MADPSKRLGEFDRTAATWERATRSSEQARSIVNRVASGEKLRLKDMADQWESVADSDPWGGFGVAKSVGKDLKSFINKKNAEASTNGAGENAYDVIDTSDEAITLMDDFAKKISYDPVMVKQNNGAPYRQETTDAQGKKTQQILSSDESFISQERLIEENGINIGNRNTIPFSNISVSHINFDGQKEAFFMKYVSPDIQGTVAESGKENYGDYVAQANKFWNRQTGVPPAPSGNIEMPVTNPAQGNSSGQIQNAAVGNETSIITVQSQSPGAETSEITEIDKNAALAPGTAETTKTQKTQADKDAEYMENIKLQYFLKNTKGEDGKPLYKGKLDGIRGKQTNEALKTYLATQTEINGAPENLEKAAVYDVSSLLSEDERLQNISGNIITVGSGGTPSTIKGIQGFLNEKLGLTEDKALTIDGEWGPQTANALKKYQEANNLTVDGIFGPQTEAKMREQSFNPEA